MLEKLDFLSQDVANIIIYANSAILQTLLKKKIKGIFKIERNLTKYADNSATLKAVKNDTITQPFGGGLWLVDVQCDKIPFGDLIKEIKKVSNSSVTIYWTSNYSQYKRLCDLEVVKKQGRYCFSMYAGKLYSEDISYIYKLIVPDNRVFSKDLMLFVKKNYTYDVQSVCELFQSISQGDEYKTTQDIISKIGIGGNTVDSFVIKLLTTNPKTEKGAKKSFENILKLLNDLAYTYEYNSIKNFMRTTVNTILEIKQLQIMGLYSSVNKNIPDENFNIDKIQRLKRYENTILETINIGRVLNLKTFLDKYRSFNSEIDLLKSLSDYLSIITEFNINNPESKEIGLKKSRKFRV